MIMLRICQAGQPLLNSMLPAGVVVGMRQQAPSQQQQKNVPTNPLSRVVINSHMAGVRPQSPSVSMKDNIAITMVVVVGSSLLTHRAP